jgi:hypothetical protein
MNDENRFFETELTSPITEIALQVTSNVDGGDHYASGMAVLFAPNLAFIARHVLEEHWSRHEGRPMPLTGEVAGHFTLLLLQIVNGQGNLWSVRRLWTAELTDIVVLHVQSFSEGAARYHFRNLTLELMPPRVGEAVAAFGYHGNETEILGPRHIQIRALPSTSHGEVIEVHHHHRDIAFLRFPCFRTNARFEGGMSGGPVFNASGHLCGLVCAALPPTADHEEYVGYVVLLWPAMAIPIDVDREGHPRGVRYPLVELQSFGLMIQNADRLRIGPLEEARTPDVGFLVARDPQP